MSDYDLFWKEITAVQRLYSLSSEWGLRTVLKIAVALILKHGHSDEFLKLLKCDAKQAYEKGESFEQRKRSF